MNIKILQETIGYSFKDQSLLDLALTHSSYLQGHKASKVMCNERLEFIGDGILDSVVGIRLYQQLDQAEEGELTKVRAGIVCERSLAKIGRQIKINQYLKLSRGEESLGGRDKDSIIADSVEALIGAVYMDGGYEVCEELILRLFDQTIKEGEEHKLAKDYKSLIQETLQKRGTIKDLKYVVTKEEGPSHDKTFYVSLLHSGKVIGQGVGKKKKDAEQLAAKAALEKGGLK
ncbi:MAG: ribonuclease III [Clostridia bacterium]|nr:ribonuclease III [Clostridia bacterium]